MGEETDKGHTLTFDVLFNGEWRPGMRLIYNEEAKQCNLLLSGGFEPYVPWDTVQD
jgi:hypothetical protein